MMLAFQVFGGHSFDGYHAQTPRLVFDLLVDRSDPRLCRIDHIHVHTRGEIAGCGHVKRADPRQAAPTERWDSLESMVLFHRAPGAQHTARLQLLFSFV